MKVELRQDIVLIADKLTIESKCRERSRREHCTGDAPTKLLKMLSEARLDLARLDLSRLCKQPPTYGCANHSFKGMR